MRVAFPLVVLLLFSQVATAQPPIAFDDAAIHAVQFIDASEGWAAGDDGVVWHSVDGGMTWERQKTGTRASLRGVHFLTPYTGWAVGRIESPNSGPSIGVMLRTTDGGIKWEEVGTNVLPGLHAVKFFDEKNGFVCGDGGDAFPSGMFTTTDSGRTWRPASGPRVPGWRGADASPTRVVVAVGAWSKMGTFRDHAFTEADIDPLGGRNLNGVKFGSQRAFAVGDGGAVLTSSDGGHKWGSVNLGLSPTTLANCDFKCVATAGAHVWVAGRPGSLVLHSSDNGATWNVQKTGILGTVNGISFLDENTGWVVGELGTIAGTTDGGKTWKVQRLGGQRSAVLFLHAKGKNVPLETVAILGAGEGYFCAAVGLMTADPATADPKRASETIRLRQAMRQAGGTTAETAWCFPLPAHAEGLSPRDLLAVWDRTHGGKANEQLLRQAVLAIRLWQPEVLVTDIVTTNAAAEDMLVLFAAKEAFKQASDPNCFPEQITDLGLQPWAAKKLYAISPEDPSAPVKIDATEFHKVLADSPRDFSEAARGFAGSDVASADRRCFKLLAHRLAGAESHTNIMDGIPLARGGACRRAEPAATDPTTLGERQQAAQSRKHLEGLAASSDKELGGWDRALAALVNQTDKMPDDMAARTTYAVGMKLAQAGRWPEAREVFVLLTFKYPGHPLAMDGYRWLLRYHASSETRRRVEIQQKLAFKTVSYEKGPNEKVIPANGSGVHGLNAATAEDIYRLHSPDMIFKWHQGCLDFEPRLAAFGPMHSRDPSAWLNFLAARRQVGKHTEAQTFIADYFKNNPGTASMNPGIDPWRDCLAAELWLTQPNALPSPPKNLGICRLAESRPFLDGKLDDPCWANLQPLALKGTSGDSEANVYRTEARFAYDDKFLYIAVSCSHPAGQKVEPVAKRARDSDLTGHDRVDILLDLDRDYQTYYRFQIDHRGCLAEDCWGDRSWNPKYYVAFLPSDTGWTAEIAIPLVELTGDRPGHGRVWAANVTRVIPGKGTQSWSGPADSEPRPEMMGLLQFRSTN